MSHEWLELGYQIPYQTFLELRSGSLFDIMNLHPLSMFFHHLGWFSSFLVCLWLRLNLTCPPTTSSTSSTDLQNPQLKAFASILAVLRSMF